MERLLLVDALRALSVALVLAVHLHGSGRIDTHASATWNQFAENGSYGVYVFFVLSGFLISRQLLAGGVNRRSDVLRFWLRRVARIWPLVALTVVVGALGLALVPAGPAREFCLDRVDSRFDTAFWLSIPTFTLNWLRIVRSHIVGGWGLHWDILWSLAIEEQFYLLYPLLLLLVRQPLHRLGALLAVVAVGAAFDGWLLHGGRTSFLWLTTNSPMGFASLAMGCLAWLAHVQLRELPVRVRLPGLLLGLAMATLVYLRLPLGVPVNCLVGPLLLSLGIALTVAFAADLAGTYKDGDGRGWLVLPGKWSFACYLLHPLGLWLLWNALGGQNHWLAFGLLGAVTAVLAGVSWQLVEEPARKWIVRRWLPAR